MSRTQPRPWYYPWAPLGLGVLLTAGVIALVLIGPTGPQRAAAASMAPQSPVGFQTTDKLVLSVTLPKADKPTGAGPLKVQLIDSDGKVIAEEERSVKPGDSPSTHRFEFASPKIPVEKVTLRCRFDKEQMETPLNRVLLVKAHETLLSGGVEFFSGAPAAMRCEVHGVKSYTETVPLTDASVAIQLKDKDGKTYPVYKGKTGTDGVAAAELNVPGVPNGAYKLQIVTKSDLGEETLERDVNIRKSPKVLLVSDKPLYQPGQLMHLRALALQSFDLKPVADADLTFEVEDAKGNKVFKRTEKLSEFGVASVDFQLADEVNAGDYHVRAVLGQYTADKTVVVKPYVLPKYKNTVTADKKFYLPKETIHADLQSDYFFGKPVAGAKVKVTASTFDVAFKDFLTWDGKTDADGHVKFDVELPASFVGQPLQKGDALVKLEVKITDTADHTETVVKTLPVSDQAVRISLLPEGGRLTPGLENRVFAAATYPDGSPAAKCEINLWQGQKADGKPFATVTTNDAGLSEVRFTPKAEQFRAGQPEMRTIEMLGGNAPQVWAPKNFYDLFAEAKDSKGEQANAAVALTSEPLGENVLLRLDKAVYQGGDSLKVDVLSSAGLPTVYLDVVKSGQTVLTKWLDVKDGKAAYKLDLPPSLFGTLEIHAYQMIGDGAIIRDARVVYVQPANDLKIEVKANKDVYAPGEIGNISFRVTDAHGKPTAAALGVLIVDEAVYALQEMQPGLEKVYFTLQEELLKPQVEVHYKPGDTVESLVRQPELDATKQQIAEALLTGVRPKPPARWDVNPVMERKQKIRQQAAQIGAALSNYAQGHKDFLVQNKETKAWGFKPDLLKEIVEAKQLDASVLTDPMGGKLTLESLAKMEKDFTADKLAAAVARQRIWQLEAAVVNYSVAPERQKQWFKDNKWTLPDGVLADAAKAQNLDAVYLTDPWGTAFRLVKLDKKRTHPQGWAQFEFTEVVSAGPDGKFDTADDVKMGTITNPWFFAQMWWDEDQMQMLGAVRLGEFGGRGGVVRREMLRNEFAFERGAKGKDGAPFPPGAPQAGGPAGGNFPKDAKEEDKKSGGGGAGGPAPPRIREFFPETLFWAPSLITDGQGRAELPLTFADSITTWRLTASASSTGGALGGVDAPLRVFQDFFVDLDLPVALTQDDEVAFPVAVYNYLKTPQTVTLDLKREAWFELTEGGYTRKLDLQPNEVTSVKFRIRASKIGKFPLTVSARGTKASDAIHRDIDVAPNGKPVDQVASDRLSGKVSQTITIPENAIPDASKLFVKVYPGVQSQVLDGADGILRMPGGCFEQTSSSAYPNVLAVDYIKKNKLQSPAILMKAEQYLNVGYQRLLTFEHKAGGFDWWGKEENEPLIWLSAYGLQEFNDMSKVYPVDHGVIDRTQAWLLKQQAADGTWDKIGATHSESIASMGDPKLLLTSYVTWALLDSGVQPDQLKKSVEYIRTHAKDSDNAYILALAANALAAWDSKDDDTHAVLVKLLRKLDELKEERADWKAIAFPCKGQSLAYARGESLTVEATALATLAMLKSGQFPNDVNKALVYIVKSKDPHGTWGSTSATILSLKALIAAATGPAQKEEATFTVAVNGKQAAAGKVNADNSDVMQLFDLKEYLQPGANDVTIETKGETNLVYQVVGRHFEPWKQGPAEKPLMDVAVDYDRTELTTADVLRAKARLKYNGKIPTAMVMLDLGIPPGFTADAGDFAEMVGAKKIQKFSLTSRQAILYLGDVEPGKEYTFEYTLKPKYPVKAKTPSSTAYEYYTPANRATAAPVELVVSEKK
jgi:hypothetical protein